MPKKTICLFLMLVLWAGLSSCTFFRQLVGLDIQKPAVKVLSIKAGKVDQASVQLYVRVQVRNPNDFEITLSDIKYFLRLNDQEAGSGHYHEKITFPASADQEVVLPFLLNLRNSLEVLQKILFRQHSQLNVTWNALFRFHSQVGPISLEVTDQKKLI